MTPYFSHSKMTNKLPENSLQALQIFAESYLVVENPKLFSNVETTLRKYVLPCLHFHEAELKNLDDCLIRLSIRQLSKEALNAFEEQTERLMQEEALKLGTLKNYRSALNRFLRWLRSEPWYDRAICSEVGTHAPRIFAKGASLCEARRGKGRYNRKEQNYGLVEAELPTRVRRQLQAQPYELTSEDFLALTVEQVGRVALPTYGFHYFCTAPEVPKRREMSKGIRPPTFKVRKSFIFLFLGWLHQVRKYPLSELGLELMLNRELLEEFVCWGISVRKNGYGWAAEIAKTAVSLAKWLHHRRSNRANYQDIDEIAILKEYQIELINKYKAEPSRAHLEEKMLTFPQCIAIVNRLRKCTAERDESGHSRALTGITFSWLRYLAILILIFCPVRQRELRELELGRTLFRESDGYWVKLSPDDHKEGSKTGKGREFPLPEHLTEALDEWFKVWRPQIKCLPEHQNLVFVTSGINNHKSEGNPYDTPRFHRLVAAAIYSTTAFLIQTGHPEFKGQEPKRTSPHDFRRIAVTWQRKNGDPAQREALAAMMGHSVEMADRIYNQMTNRDLTQKAAKWWEAPSSKSDEAAG